MTRICPRCGDRNTLLIDGGIETCQACGHRPEGSDPGQGSQSALQVLRTEGRERHSKGSGVSA